MRPILFTFSLPGISTPIPVPSYGILAAIGSIVAFCLFLRSRRTLGQDAESMVLVCAEILALGLLGSTLGNGVLHLLEGKVDPQAPGLKVFTSGLAWQGGLLLAVPAGIWYIKFIKFPVRATLDAFAIPLLVGYAIGRVGCLMAGCCYGQPTSLPWGIVYPEGNPFGGAPAGIHLHPAPVYSILGIAVVIGILLGIKRKVRHEGHLFLFALFLHSITRFLVEFARGDHGPEWQFFSNQQLFALLCAGIAAVVILKERKQTLGVT